MLSKDDDFRLLESYQNDTLDLFSLINFKDILKPIILHPSIKSICEIGCEESSLTLWLALLSKIKKFDYCNVNLHLNSLPAFQYQAKLIKENLLDYLAKTEADYDIFLMNAKHNYNAVYNVLSSIFLNKKHQQSICFIHNIFSHPKNNDSFINSFPTERPCLSYYPAIANDQSDNRPLIVDNYSVSGELLPA